MNLQDGLHDDAKKLNPDLLLGKPSDCKYCRAISASVWVNYDCTNNNCKGYGLQPPLCSKNCEGYEKEELATTE